MDFYDALWADLQGGIADLIARRQRRRRRAVFAAIISTCLLLVTGVALGAARVFGWPAPGHVQDDIAAVDRGLPEDLRLNPDARNARAVAAGDSSTLYAADLRDGGHCTEIVTADGRGRGATCTTAPAMESQPIEVTLPSDDHATASSPVVIGGRLNIRAERVEVDYGGVTDWVPLGDDGYFVFDVPTNHLAAAHATAIVVTARAHDGAALARVTVPSDWDEPALPDERQPLYVSTRSDESDFTKVYGLEGHVSASGATRLELRYDDGATVAIPIKPDGSYFYAVQLARIGDFMRPQLLLALNAHGRAVAQAPVAAVAFWRGRERRP